MVDYAAFYRLDGPLAPSPTPRQTRASHLQGFADLLRRSGMNPISLLERHDIDPTVLGNPDCYVGCMPLMETIEYCSRALDAPLFSLDLAVHQPQLLGFVGSLCQSAPDLATAFECLRDFLPVMHSPECLMRLNVGRTISELHCDSWLEHPALDQLAYGSVLTLLRLCAKLTDNAFRPHYVLLKPRPRSADVDRLEREYGCKVHIGQPHTAIGFSTDALSRPLASTDRVSHRLLRDYADSVRADQRRSLLARVQDFIRGALEETCNLAHCAAALGMSARKLQLQLDAHGVSFSELLTRQREEMARAYLAADTLDLDEVAHRLGYADQTSFGRAFRRWTGTSPGAFKADAMREGRS